MPLDAIRDDRAARAAGRGRLRRRGVRRVRRRRRSFPSSPRFPNVVVGRTFSKAFGLAGLRIGCRHRRARTRSSRSAWRCPSTASTSPRSSPCRRRSAIATTSSDYLRQVDESKALLYAACERLGLDVLEERGELRAGARRRPRATRWSTAPPSAASTCAIARPSRAAPAASASPPGVVEHTRRCIAVHGGGAVRRAVIDRRTTETQIALTLGARRQGPVRGPHRHPVSRSHARALRAARRRSI